MYTPTQIEAIKIFGNKKLSFGCIVSQGGDEYQIFNFSDRFKNARYWDNEDEDAMMIMNGGYKILGHIPTLEDIFRVAKEKGEKIGIGYGFGGAYITYYNGDGIFPYNPTIPVLEQDEKSLKELISLFK